MIVKPTSLYRMCFLIPFNLGHDLFSFLDVFFISFDLGTKKISCGMSQTSKTRLNKISNVYVWVSDAGTWTRYMKCSFLLSWILTRLIAFMVGVQISCFLLSEVLWKKQQLNGKTKFMKYIHTTSEQNSKTKFHRKFMKMKGIKSIIFAQ